MSREIRLYGERWMYFPQIFVFIYLCTDFIYFRIPAPLAFVFFFSIIISEDSPGCFMRNKQKQEET